MEVVPVLVVGNVLPDPLEPVVVHPRPVSPAPRLPFGSDHRPVIPSGPFRPQLVVRNLDLPILYASAVRRRIVAEAEVGHRLLR